MELIGVFCFFSFDQLYMSIYACPKFSNLLLIENKSTKPEKNKKIVPKFLIISSSNNKNFLPISVLLSDFRFHLRNISC